MKLTLALLLVLSCSAAFAQHCHKDGTECNLEDKIESSVNDANADGAKLWAVLVAGSNTWWNYRHQADVCHAYQILNKHGIPDDRIIVMMYDDIANSEENPTKGIIINHPSGSDVYHGVPKDYTGDDVNPENFLNVLKGDSEAMKNLGSGKVLGSGPNDHVFINFVDHGAQGLVAFPNDELYAKPLVNALTAMSERKQFKKLVFYLEACESGSMFEDLLPSNVGIFATTASSADESSYACYYDESRDTYLGDVYSVNWMENSDANNIEMETLETQFNDVKKLTTTSSCQQYGEMSLSTDDVGQFQGETKAQNVGEARSVIDAVPSQDVPLHILQHKLAKANTESEKLDLQLQLDMLKQKRSLVHMVVKRILQQVLPLEQVEAAVSTKSSSVSDHDCLQAVSQAFGVKCFKYSEHPYALNVVSSFVNACQMGDFKQSLLSAISDVCSQQLLHSL